MSNFTFLKKESVLLGEQYSQNVRRNHFALKCKSKINSLRENSEESDDSDVEYITSVTDRSDVIHAVTRDGCSGGSVNRDLQILGRGRERVRVLTVCF